MKMKTTQPSQMSPDLVPRYHYSIPAYIVLSITRVPWLATGIKKPIKL